MRAGQRYGITPIGTEAMHVLRAEKGFIIAGQDSDGTVIPADLGMSWAVSKSKDFIGKRSMSRPDSVRSDRKQLVGLLTEDAGEVLPEGGQIVGVAIMQMPAAEDTEMSPAAMFSQLGNMQEMMSGLILPAADVVKATRRAVESVESEAAPESGDEKKR